MIYPSPIIHSDGDALELKRCFLPTSICFISGDDREQWEEGLLQGVNNASAESYLNHLRILQQRPLANESVVCEHVCFLST